MCAHKVQYCWHCLQTSLRYRSINNQQTHTFLRDVHAPKATGAKTHRSRAPAPTMGVLVICSDFSPAFACAHPLWWRLHAPKTCWCTFPKSTVAAAMPRWEHADNEAAMVGPHPSLHVLTMVLLWQTCAPCQLHPRPHLRPFGLSLHSQTKSPHQVCPLKPEFQHPAPVHTGWPACRAAKCTNVQRPSMLVSLYPTWP